MDDCPILLGNGTYMLELYSILGGRSNRLAQHHKPYEACLLLHLRSPVSLGSPRLILAGWVSNYKSVLILARQRDHRVATQVLLYLGAADKSSESIKNDPATEIPVMKLYPALVRIVEDTNMKKTAMFSYAEVSRCILFTVFETP